MRLSPTACWSRRQPAKGGSLSGYLRRERATHCGKGTSGARLVHGGKGHPGHALCSKECGRCGLVTRAVRCCARHPRHTTLGLAIGGSRRIRIQVSLVRFPGRALWYCEGARGATLRQGLSAPPSARGVSTSPAAWPLLPAPAACGGGLRRRLAAAACGGGLRRLRRRAKGDIWCVSSARLPPRI